MHATAEAATFLNVPAAHAVTLLPSLVYPALALQSVAAVEPVAEPVPELEGQPVQATADVIVSLYLPEVHAATELPLPVYPAPALQSITVVEPVPEPVSELEGQSVQATADGVVSLYFPEEHAATEFPLPVYPA